MFSFRSKMISSIRDYCTEQGEDCFLWVGADKYVAVPEGVVRDGWVVLDISPTGADAFEVKDGWVSFIADFPGHRDFQVCLPENRIVGVGSANHIAEVARFAAPTETTESMIKRCPYPELFGLTKESEGFGFHVVD